MTLLRLLKQAPLSAKIGMFIILINIIVAVFAPLIAPYEEAAKVGDVWSQPSISHLMGTDQLGRDLFTRMVYGARNTISIALIITCSAFAIGAVLGLLAATLGGIFDMLTSRAVDIVMAFPPLILALMVLSIFGTSVPVLILIISLLDSTKVYRLARALAMDIRAMEFVEVALLRGEGLYWIIRREILPNAMPALIAEFGLRFCFIFLFISALSFLGLGLQPPTADWGSMVRENAGAIAFGITIPLYPAGAIAILTVGINLVVDWFLHRSAQIRAN